MKLLAGTYTQELHFVKGTGSGIHSFSLDEEYTQPSLQNGSILPIGPNPTYIIQWSENRYVSLCESVLEGDISKIVLFKLDQEGHMTIISECPTQATSSTHLARAGDHLLVANYVSGDITVLKHIVNETKEYFQFISQVKHSYASSSNKDRQLEPHPHMVYVDSYDDTRYRVLVPDLGGDRVYQYTLVDGELVLDNAMGFVALPNGSGPRHLSVVHGVGKMYVLLELTGQIAVFDYSREKGVLSTNFSLVDTLPSDFKEFNLSAAIRVTSDEIFLYISNRGHDSLACYAICPNTGNLSFVAYTPTLGKAPRDFILDCSETRILVGNQDTHSIAVFDRNVETGLLSPSCTVIPCPSPVTLLLCPEN